METKFKDIEFMLGYSRQWGEYEIIEHNIHHPTGDGTFCFRIGKDLISDGDGFPASYDNTYVKIEEKDYRHVMGMFHKAGEEIDALAIKHGKPITRPIAPGDYIYDGGYFIHVQNISSDRKKLWIEEFYYDYYDLNVYMDLDVVDKNDDFDINEMESEGLFITSEIYHDALNIAKSAIIEISDCLNTLYSDKLNQMVSNQ